MIQDEQKQTLIKYRIEQAKETVFDAQILIKNEKYRSAVNRIYYAMFYITLALGLKYGFETSKHLQLIGWFNKNFVKEGKIQEKYGKMLRETYKHRQEGDYVAFIEFSLADVEVMYSDAIDFINEIEKYALP